MVLGFGSNNGDEDTMDESCPGLSLTRTQRFYGFGICFVLGFLISVLSSLSVIGGKLSTFAVLYTLGNIVSLASTGFLVGFVKQLKTAFKPVRVWATVIFLVSMILTLVVALVLKNVALTILCCIIQFCALFWYSASYIPYARQMIRSCCGNAVNSVV